MQRTVYLVLMITSGVTVLRSSEEVEQQFSAAQPSEEQSVQRFQSLRKWPLSFMRNATPFMSFGFTSKQLPTIIAFACKSPIKIIQGLQKKFPGDMQRRKRWVEGYDWICACYVYESYLLKKSFDLSVELIKEINQAVVRTTGRWPGRLRSANGMRVSINTTAQEKMLIHCLARKQKSFAVQEFYDAQTSEIRVDDLYQFFSCQGKLNMFGCEDLKDFMDEPFSFQASDADYNEIKSWATEQGKDDTFDSAIWFRQRFYMHPPANRVEGILNHVVQQARSIRHPIGQASFLFISLIQLHPFFNGNKRTVRLLLAILLGRAGIAPVCIDAQNRHEYEQLLMQALVAQTSKKMQAVDRAFCRFFVSQ